MWKSGIYIDHCTMEGLCSVGNIQGCLADALVTIFHEKSIGPVLKWVDDFAIFNSPVSSGTIANDVIEYLYSYDLPTIMDIMDSIGIPWHPIENQRPGFHIYGFLCQLCMGPGMPLHLPFIKRVLKISIQSPPFASHSQH